MGQINLNLPKVPLLEEEEVKSLIIKAQTGDKNARDKMVQCNLRLVYTVIQRFYHRGYEPEDLFQIGTIGLMKAIDKFDFSYQVRFSTYAVPLILGEIKRFLRDDSPIKVSRSLKEQAIKIHACQEALWVKLGREATVAEIADEMCLRQEDVITALEANQSITSLQENVYRDREENTTLLEQLEDKKAESHWFESLLLKDIMEKLPQREKYILEMRFFQDKTQSEIAKSVGISQVQVSRLERSALKKVREYME